MAAALQDQGKWSEAEALFQAVLEARKHILGDEHLDTLGTRHNLAVVLHKQGKAADAEAMLVRFSKHAHASSTPDHPDILATRHNLPPRSKNRARPTKRKLCSAPSPKPAFASSARTTQTP
ncbi:MAG: tetratricopeptide repeat protein [Sandaracinaceae bacterium]|nr:tetratricopeptide repeat protein [Sandaracinaceae bacterium]